MVSQDLVINWLCLFWHGLAPSLLLITPSTVLTEQVSCQLKHGLQSSRTVRDIFFIISFSAPRIVWQLKLGKRFRHLKIPPPAATHTRTHTQLHLYYFPMCLYKDKINLHYTKSYWILNCYINLYKNVCPRHLLKALRCQIWGGCPEFQGSRGWGRRVAYSAMPGLHNLTLPGN